jgi:hypothetical protein
MSENCMPYVLTIIVQVIERNPYVQKHKKLSEVYRAVDSEEVQLKFVWTASDD